MAGKTKEMLYKEILSLEHQVDDLNKEIDELNVEKNYWYVKAEKYRCLYNMEKWKNDELLEPNKELYKIQLENKLKETEKFEIIIAEVIENLKRTEAKEVLLHSYSPIFGGF